MRPVSLEPRLSDSYDRHIESAEMAMNSSKRSMEDTSREVFFWLLLRFES